MPNKLPNYVEYSQNQSRIERLQSLIQEMEHGTSHTLALELSMLNLKLSQADSYCEIGDTQHFQKACLHYREAIIALLSIQNWEQIFKKHPAWPDSGFYDGTTFNRDSEIPLPITLEKLEEKLEMAHLCANYSDVYEKAKKDWLQMKHNLNLNVSSTSMIYAYGKSISIFHDSNNNLKLANYLNDIIGKSLANDSAEQKLININDYIKKLDEVINVNKYIPFKYMHKTAEDIFERKLQHKLRNALHELAVEYTHKDAPEKAVLLLG